MSKDEKPANAPEEKPKDQPEVTGISKIEPKDSEIIESQLPEAPNTRKLIEDLLQKKVSEGHNLSDKSVYPRIFDEIAQQVNCSYSHVQKTAKKFFNKSARLDEKIESEKSQIIIKGVGADTRPPPRPKPQEPVPTSAILSNDAEAQNLELEFEQTMLEMSFDSVGNFENMVLGVRPKTAKLKKMARTIAIFNQKMVQAGHPEKTINIGEDIQRYMIYAAIAGTFLEPLGEKWAKGGSKKTEGIEQKQSMRS